MAALSKAQIAVLSLALVGAGGAALGLGVLQFWRASSSQNIAQDAPAADAGRLAALPESSVVASAKPDVTGALSDKRADIAPTASSAEAKASTAIADLPLSPAPPAVEERGPAFDVARVDPDGQAVIAGRAAPGATVELLREGEVLESTVADASGEFVMVPQRLPRGNYDLTLRAKARDGAVERSKRSVAVALNDIGAGTVNSSALGSSSSRPVQSVPTASQTYATAAAVPTVVAHSDSKAEAAGSAKLSSRVVARGDSLWRISKIAYGNGARYAVIYNANRGHIRNPDRIYPGQTFLLPEKTR